MQVKDDNEDHVPPTVEHSSDREGEELVMVDEDMSVSPLIPSAEFHDADNPTGIAGVEEYGGALRLKRRPPYSPNRRIIYCIMPNSPLTSVNPRYGLTSITTRF